jgi:hypothetical protein
MGHQPIAAGIPHRFWVDGILGCGHERVQNLPARSPDLIPPSFYMLWRIKYMVYKVKVDMRECILIVAKQISCLSVLFTVSHSILKWAVDATKHNHGTIQPPYGTSNFSTYSAWKHCAATRQKSTTWWSFLQTCSSLIWYRDIEIDIVTNVNRTGSHKALPCTFLSPIFCSWPDDDPIVGSKLVALYNK